jgi:hypothetical protein
MTIIRWSDSWNRSSTFDSISSMVEVLDFLIGYVWPLRKRQISVSQTVWKTSSFVTLLSSLSRLFASKVVDVFSFHLQIFHWFIAPPSRRYIQGHSPWENPTPLTVPLVPLIAKSDLCCISKLSNYESTLVNRIVNRGHSFLIEKSEFLGSHLSFPATKIIPTALYGIVKREFLHSIAQRRSCIGSARRNAFLTYLLRFTYLD